MKLRFIVVLAIAGLLLMDCQPPNSAPDKPQITTGSVTVAVNQSSYFRVLTHDRDYDSVCYRFDWGDGTRSNWTKYSASGIGDSAAKAWTKIGTYAVRAVARDAGGMVSDSSDAAQVSVVTELPNRPPATPAAPTGPDTVWAHSIAIFTAVTTDPDGDDISYQFDWGDGRQSAWSGLAHSGVPVTDSTAWPSPGSYGVRVMARDDNGTISDWSGYHYVSVWDTVRAAHPNLTP